VESTLDATSIKEKRLCVCAVISSALNLTHVCSVSGEGAVLEAGVTRGAHSSPATCPLENECSWHQAPTGFATCLALCLAQVYGLSFRTFA
jgi:hypothetical protein